MRQISAILIIALLMSCKKNNYEYMGQGKYFNYTCTIRPYTTEDTIPGLNQDMNQYSMLIGELNEVVDNYSISFLMNGHILRQFRIVETYTEGEPTLGDRTEIYVSFDSQGNSYSQATTYRNNRVFPELEHAYITIIDYPYLGWNRFVLEE